MWVSSSYNYAQCSESNCKEKPFFICILWHFLIKLISWVLDWWMDGYSWSFRFCLFVWSCYSHLRIFHSNRDVIIAGEGLQIARHSVQSNVGSLACHPYCGAMHPFIMVICENPWHSYLLPSVWQWSCNSNAAGIRTPNLPLARELSNLLLYRRSCRIGSITVI